VFPLKIRQQNVLRIKQLKKSAPNAYVIATGGLASIVSEEIEEINFTDKDMTLNGLFTIFNIYTNNKK
jgi:pantothenate kinase type III